MVGSQIANLTPSPSFGHNLWFKCPNGSCKPILDIYVLRTFQWYNEIFNSMGFDPSKLLFEDSGVHQDSNSQTGSSFGSGRVHSLTLSYTLRNMKCDSWSPLLACTFVNPCFGCKPKVRVVTTIAFLQRSGPPLLTLQESFFLFFFFFSKFVWFGFVLFCFFFFFFFFIFLCFYFIFFFILFFFLFFKVFRVFLNVLHSIILGVALCFCMWHNPNSLKDSNVSPSERQRKREESRHAP